MTDRSRWIPGLLIYLDLFRHSFVIHVASCTSPRRPFDLFSRAAPFRSAMRLRIAFKSEHHFPQQREDAHAFPKLRETD